MYQKGKTIRKSKMSLVCTKNTRGFTRVAVVVSKKVDKSAVGRNRIRRRIYDYIFVVYSKDVAKMPFDKIEKTLGELVNEAKVCYNG